MESVLATSFSGSYIQFLRVAGTGLPDDISDEAAIDGTIPDMPRLLDEKMIAHNHRRVDFVNEIRERRIDNYPLATLRKLTRNAVMHRVYEATDTPVRVTWFDDRIEIQSQRGPYGTVDEENCGKDGGVDYRNPNLDETMKIMGYVQKFGAGIPTARRLLVRSGHPDLEFHVDQSHVLATVRSAPDAKKPSR